MRYSVYRATIEFMSSLNHDNNNLKLHRDRQFEHSSGSAIMLTAIQSMLNKGFLVKAATVDCELNELYEMTNSIESDWTANPNVTIISKFAFMSCTSVGDVFTDNVTGQAYLVGTFEISKVSLVFDGADA